MLTLYGISNCDTVKKARKWLEQAALEYQFHDFRADGLTPAMVQAWLDELGAETLVNKRSTTWKQLTEAEREQALGADAAALICQHPTLIKRPLLDTGSSRQVGFSAANYQQLLG
ncbi:ArsC family reductase [Halioxenophilus sp. WMMB6]|uniref:ArsC family reductase n=1 Tax=Halioxenophilus sp. WMMB6 TaxID=3073815 RepID=UPI00295EB682|nr:ArsC family reductase [Halioxenophilus sp. WMMB6]